MKLLWEFRVVFRFLKKVRYTRRVAALHRTLGIPPDYARIRCLPIQPEAAKLQSIGADIYQREQRLVPQAAEAWQQMKASANSDGIELQLVSAYRSVDYQQGIMQRKLDQGQAVDDILCVSAAPGYSEHHSGYALDLTTPGFAVLEEEFEQSDAFAWLTRHAAKFGYHMSFPRDNPHGVIYEPWHWAWRSDNVL